MIQRVSHQAEVLDIYRHKPQVHPYGIADAQQLWDSSTWWRDGPAVVGLLRLDGTDVVYAIAAQEATATLDLLAALSSRLPDAFVITGPTGLTAVLEQGGFVAQWSDAYDKLHLPSRVVLPPPGSAGVQVLSRADLDQVLTLFATDPDAGDFFHADLLDTGYYLGRHTDGMLVAVGGVHVVDLVNSVAAIGNVATHPAYRRQGHARAVVVELLHLLRTEVEVIGLNVRHRTLAARSLYTSLGFEWAITYEEAEVARLVTSD
ncbi:MAG: GNAT family N-acetyltransferase [Euzebya sp.]